MKSVANQTFPARFAALWPWLVLLAVVVGPVCKTAMAVDAAYWRFEEGPVDTHTTVYQADWFVDSSGNGNEMWTWGEFAAPWYRSSVAATVIPQTGAANTLSLEFNPNQDNYTNFKPIESQVFTAWTVEATFMVDTLNRWQVIVGKDGKPLLDDGAPPFALKVRDDDDTLSAEVIDGSGIVQAIATNFTLTVGQWYHAAAVNDGSTFELFVDSFDGNGYVSQGSVAVTGAMINTTGSWTIGRGMWDNNIADWTDGSIDEVRISDTALSPSEFLFTPSVDNILTWNGLNGGNWNTTNWTGGSGSDIPGPPTHAILQTNTVNVTAPASAYWLTVDSGGVTVAAGQSLTIGNSVRFGSGTELSLGTGAALINVGGGYLDTVRIAGDATISNHGAMTVAALLDDGLTPGILTKEGTGLLTLDNRSGASLSLSQTTIQINAGEIESIGAGQLALGGASEVILGGGKLKVMNYALTPVADALTELWYDGNDDDASIDPIDSGDGLLVTIPDGVTLLQSSLQLDGPAMLARSGGTIPGSIDHFGAAWFGSINIGNGSPLNPGELSFGTATDDGSTLWIDLNQDGDFGDAGEMIVDNKGLHGTQNRVGNVTISTPGNYGFIVGMYENSAGEYAEARFHQGAFPGGDQIAVDDFFNNTMTPINPGDVAQNGLWVGVTNGDFDLLGVTVTVTDSSQLQAVTNGVANFGNLEMQQDGLLTTLPGPTDGYRFAATNIDIGASTVSFNPQAATHLGPINVNSPAVVIAKVGPGDLVLTAENVGTGMEKATFDVQEGRLIGVHGSNPFDTAALQLSGGELVLAGATTGAPVTFDNALGVTASSTLTAGPGNTGTTDVPVTLGSVPNNGLEVAENTVVTLRSTDGYALDVAGNLSGTGGVAVHEGTVTLSGPANALGIMRVSGGTLSTGGNDVTLSNHLKLAEVTYSIDEGNTFGASGSDLLAESDITLTGGILTVGAPGGPSGAVAYWRFEEGPVDTQTTVYQGDWFLDSSGNGNHMWTWADFTAPTYRADVSFDPVPQTGAPNGLSLEFNPNQDNYTFGKPINTHVFNELTVEASVKLDRLDLWQVIVGKDGKPTDEAFPPLFLKLLDDSDLFEAGMLDGDGVYRSILSNQVPVVGQWYDLALTSDGTTMRFYIKGPGDLDYVEQGAGIAVSGGALIDSDGSWTVGRGQWNGWNADWTDGSIDEVRITDSALVPNQFLGSVASAEPLDLRTVNFTAAADSTLRLDMFIEPILGNMTVNDGVTLAVAGVMANVNDLNLGDGAQLGSVVPDPNPASVFVRGMINVGSSPEGATIVGYLEMAEEGEAGGDTQAGLHVDIAGDLHDKLVMDGDGITPGASGLAWIAGTLEVEGQKPMTSGGSPIWGDQVLTVMQATPIVEEDGGFKGEFGPSSPGGSIPLSYGVAGTLPNEGDYLGAGLWFGNAGNDGVYYPGRDNAPNPSPEIAATAVQIGVFQAAPGDTDGNRKVEGQDILNILQAGLFGDGVTPEANWGNGDFNSDSKISGEDILALLGTGLFGDGTYPDSAAATAAAADVKLVVTGDGLVIDTDGATLTGFVLSSESGILTGDDAESLGLFQEDTDTAISGTFAMSLEGEHSLGDVLGETDADLGGDLSLAYTIAGVPGVFTASVVVPEPGTLMLLLGGLIALLIRRRRK